MALEEADFQQLQKDVTEILQLRVKPADGSYSALGEKIIQWAADPNSRPALDEDGSVKDVAAFKAEIGKYFQNLPASITKIVFVQPEPGEYYIRLPAKELVAKSASIMKRLQKLSAEQRKQLGFQYPDPGFYHERFDQHVLMSELEYLKNRVGDYTFAHCA